MIDKKLLDTQRADAVTAWRIAINLTTASDMQAVSQDQADLAVMGAVNAQANYTLSCALYRDQPPPGIEEQDIRVDLYSQGIGGLGQSLVKITHIPTGLMIQWSEEKSQLQNKAAALRKLAEKLKEIGWQA